MVSICPAPSIVLFLFCRLPPSTSIVMDTTDTNNANSPLEMTKAPRKAMALDVEIFPRHQGQKKAYLPS